MATSVVAAPATVAPRSPWWYGIVITLGMLTVALLSKWSSVQRYPPRVAKGMKQLMQEAARWSAVAEQDSNPLLRVMHATYAMAYVNAARSLAEDKDLERVSGGGVRVEELHAHVQAAQQASIQKIGSVCPEVVPEGAQVLYTGWLG
jgi:hypothetical protein